MSLTIERPETEARLLRFVQKRGMPLDDVIDEFLDDAEELEGSNLREEKTTAYYLREDDYKLTPEDIEALKQGAADIDAGRVSDARANSAERRQMILQRRSQKAA